MATTKVWLSTDMNVIKVMWWSGDHSFDEAMPTLHWRPEERLTEGVLLYRVDIFLPHLVYRR